MCTLGRGTNAFFTSPLFLFSPELTSSTRDATRSFEGLMTGGLMRRVPVGFSIGVNQVGQHGVPTGNRVTLSPNRIEWKACLLNRRSTFIL